MTRISKQIAPYRTCRVCRRFPSELHRVFLISAYRLFLRCRAFRPFRQTPSQFRPRAAVAAGSSTVTNNLDLSPHRPTWAATWATETEEIGTPGPKSFLKAAGNSRSRSMSLFMLSGFLSRHV